MRTTLLVCFLAFLGSAGSLQAAAPFVGTWKINIAQSKPAVPAQPGTAQKEETVEIQVTGEKYEVTQKGTRENGSAILSRPHFR